MHAKARYTLVFGRSNSASSNASFASSFLAARRSTPAMIAPTSQCDRLISITAISLLSKSRAVSDRLKSFGCARRHPRQSASQRQECLILAPRPIASLDPSPDLIRGSRGGDRRVLIQSDSIEFSGQPVRSHFRAGSPLPGNVGMPAIRRIKFADNK